MAACAVPPSLASKYLICEDVGELSVISQPTSRPAVVTLNGVAVLPTLTCIAVVRETTVQGVSVVPGQLAVALVSDGLLNVVMTAYAAAGIASAMSATASTTLRVRLLIGAGRRSE